MARMHVMALCATAAALRPTARRTALRIGAANLLTIAAPALADDAPIDMDKIRALAAKKGSMDMSLPGLGKDPAKDKALVDVVLGANGAVVRLDPDEVREMERIGFLVKDSFRGKAPDFWSLRDFQPRNWFSEPVDRFYGMSVAGFTAPASDRSAANEQYAASLRRSVAEKVAAVASQPSPGQLGATSERRRQVLRLRRLPLFMFREDEGPEVHRLVPQSHSQKRATTGQTAGRESHREVLEGLLVW